jgi:hypothetical protein
MLPRCFILSVLADNISVLRTLRIPKSRTKAVQSTAVESKAAKVRRFRVTNKITEGEATYYLESANYDEAASNKCLMMYASR